MSLRDWYWKRWIRRQGGKVSLGVSKFGKRAVLDLEQEVRLGDVILDCRELSIGAHTYIRSDCLLQLVESIGRFCSIGSGAVIGQEKNTHPVDWLSTHPFQYTGTPLEYTARVDMASIGHDVWIGHSAMVMEGVKVGTGAIIATRAVVTRDVPPYAVVAGVPAKVVRYRYPPEMIERLLASRWWERDVQALQRLPLNDPAACLAAIEPLPPARYGRIRISRKGGEVLAGPQ
ncbi:CatB-related O-acetyltransferase [Pseudomonas sichuanensis]|uniref:CatB-related O-acetyltransferase n=1 Tax=Pseudomonas sichuanensis TaxID=2213015 RepID=UPI00216084B8|nr:CatB-related O-acetyltransferase [Pseudomonas sichuanensis]UVL89741.1 CatB-related O-acetyltransferase [Pseudomonas sichuanensis]